MVTAKHGKETLLSQLEQYQVASSIALSDSLHELGLSLRVVNALESREVPNAGVRVSAVCTVGQLLELSAEDILAIPNLGEKTLRAIFAKLATRGWVRKGETPPLPTVEDRLEMAKRNRQRELRDAIAYR